MDQNDYAEMDAALAEAQPREDTAPSGETQDAAPGPSDDAPSSAESEGREGDRNPSGGDGPDRGKPGPEPTGDGKGEPGSEERKAYNRAQAAMRVARKRERERERFYERMKRLEEERDRYADEKAPDHNPGMAAFKQDQMRELETEQVRRLQDEFEEEAYRTFQDEQVAQSFIDDCKHYADWINGRERELSEYIKKPYGKLVLKGWFDKVAKNPNAADWWQSMTSFEKYRTLDRYYREFSDFIDRYNRGEIGEDGKPRVAVPAKNVPVPGSGRNTNNAPATNNFALELESAMRANGVNRLVR